MAITSVGYDGPVTDSQWPVFSWNLVAGYTVGGAGDLKVTATVGDRTVAIANGTAVGVGVMDTATSLTPIALPSVGAGSRWDLISVRRNWSTNTTTIVRTEGTALQAIPAGREDSPGTLDDQPLALVRVAAGSATIQDIIDLRVWVSDGGAYAGNDLVLSFLNRLGVQIRIGEHLWSRELDSLGSPVWVSVTQMSVSAPVAFAAGWYANRGGAIPPQATRAGGRVHLEGTVDVNAPTSFSAGISYQLGTVPAGFRPAGEVFGIVRFGSSFATVLVQPSGAVYFVLPAAVSVTAGQLIFALTGLSWPVA